MKLMVSAKPFTADLKSVLPAIATRSGLPMLSGVRLEASESEVAIEATDLELTARRVVRGDVTVDGAGSVVVPAKALVKAVAAMGEPKIVLESDSSDGRAGLDVRGGTRTVTLQGWPTDDWPAVPRVAAIDPIASIDASATVGAFERVALCASDDEARPQISAGWDQPSVETDDGVHVADVNVDGLEPFDDAFLVAVGDHLGLLPAWLRRAARRMMSRASNGPGP